MRYNVLTPATKVAYFFEQNGIQSRPCGDLFYFLLSDLLPTSLPKLAWENVITTAFIALALGVGMKLSFARIEKQQLLICAILVSGTFLGTLLVRPLLWKTVISSVCFGRIPPFPEWAPADAVQFPALTMATTFGYVGASVISYIVYANWVSMHRWGITRHQDIEAIRMHASTRSRIDYLPEDPGQVRRLLQLVTPLRWDVTMGATVLFFVSAAFMVSGAAVLFPLETRFEGWSLLTNQRHVWSTIHPSLVWIYYVCIIAALWGTLQALPEVYARVGTEFFQAIWPQRKWSFDRVKVVACLYIFATATVIVWANVPFDILTQIAGFLITNVAITLIMFAAIYLNYILPAAYRTHRFILWGTVGSTLILFVSAVISGWGLFHKLTGG